jgi:hypothetical protein
LENLVESLQPSNETNVDEPDLKRPKPIPLSKGWGVMIAKQPFVTQPS